MTEQSPKHPTGPAAPSTRPLPHLGYPTVLAGQPALVTGANSGIGEAVAIGLAQAGADVVVNYVTAPEVADDVCHRIEAMGRRAIAIEADVSKEDVPYKRIGEPEDVARTAVWIASDAADYVTGATFFVDGGMTLYPGFATGG